jgi:hypothetical protein
VKGFYFRAVLCALVIGIFVLVSGIACATMPARPDDVLWSETFDGNGNYSCLSVARAPDGGYVFAGLSIVALDMSACAGRADPNGSLLWQNNYPSGNSVFNAAISTLDGNFLFAGECGREYGSGHSDGFLLKTGPGGNVLFSRSYNISGGSLYFRDLVQEADGSLVILGTMNNQTFVDSQLVSGASYIYVLKIDASGDQIWSRTYGSGDIEGFDITRSPDGGYAIAGDLLMGSRRFSCGYLLQVDSNGDKLWDASYPEADSTTFFTICNASAGGYLLAGTRYVEDVNKIYLSRVAANGTGLWNRTLDLPGVAYDALQATAGGFVVACGDTILKVNSDGSAAWERGFGPGSSLDSVVEAADGSYVFGGTTGGNNGNFSTWLVDIGMTKGPGPSPVCFCWPALVLPAVVISVVALLRRRQG